MNPGEGASAGGRAPGASAGGAGERLQNVIARAGLASRRHAAVMIAAGRVRVNGEIACEPGRRVFAGRDVVTLDGAPLPAASGPRRTIMIHKPAGLLCSADRSQGPIVGDLVAHLPQRLVPAGRLDKESSGLLLLSDDGDLIARLTHPRHGHRKVYEVEVAGRCDAAALACLRAPMTLDGHALRPVEVRQLRRRGGRAWLRFVLREGRHRQIRRMCGRAGLTVVRLQRVAVGPLALGALRPGEWRDLTAAEIAALKRAGDGAPRRRAGGQR